jgi:phosphoesterase RecJ-like protein
MDYKRASTQFRELLNNYPRFTLLMHKRPDGDTIGSALALYEVLKDMGKSVEVVSFDGNLSNRFAFLKSFNKIKKRIDFDNSLIVTLDCADINRTGFDLTNKDIVNIDHHKSNTNFGILNIVSIDVSTTVVLYRLLKEGFNISKDAAEALYCGLLTDSINFTTSLVSRDTFLVAKELLEYGLDINYISNYINKHQSLAHIRAKAKAINNLELLLDARLAITTLDTQDIKETGVKISDIDGIIDEFIALATVEIAILLTNFDGIIKASIRSKNEDISTIAQHFGGGGHKNASGFEVKNGKIENIKLDIIEYIKDKIYG